MHRNTNAEGFLCFESKLAAPHGHRGQAGGQRATIHSRVGTKQPTKPPNTPSCSTIQPTNHPSKQALQPIPTPSTTGMMMIMTLSSSLSWSVCVVCVFVPPHAHEGRCFKSARRGHCLIFRFISYCLHFLSLR